LAVGGIEQVRRDLSKVIKYEMTGIKWINDKSGWIDAARRESGEQC